MFGCSVDVAMGLIGLGLLFATFVLLQSSLVRGLRWLAPYRTPLTWVCVIASVLFLQESSLLAVSGPTCAEWQGWGYPCWWLMIWGCSCASN